MEQRYLDDFWQIERLRFTAFIRPEADTQSYKSWIDLLGEEPDKLSFSKKENLLQAEGIFNNGKLISQVQPNRFDWHFSFLEAEEEIEVKNEETAKILQEPQFRTVGPLKEEIINPFKKLIFFWLEGSEQIIRLAFGAVLLCRVKDQTAGYKKIDLFLPKICLDVESRDFLYQINRRRPSRTKISSLDINRLSKWSVARLLHTQKATLGSSACRLELDINTIQEFVGTLPVDKLSEIFQELIDLGVEIAKEGDIP